MLATITALLTLLVAQGAQPAPPLQRIVTASNVRLRSAPQTNAEIVSTLSLGTVVTELEGSMDAAWHRVRTPDGNAGWISSSLTEPFSKPESVAIYARILKARLENPSLNFAEASEAFLLADRITPEVRGSARAEFDLLRLRALARSLDQIAWFEPEDRTHREWIKKHQRQIVYGEPAGQWFLQADLLWELEKRHRGNPVADEIAWEAAGTGLPGECEGYIPCHMAILLMSRARYVELYPNGSHVEEALEDIDYLLVEALKPDTPYFMDSREAVQLRESIAKMTGIVERTSSARKVAMLARLKRMEAAYAR
jgi:SH3-like domain-containing protein